MADWPPRPMEPVSREDPFDDPGYQFEPKWDGIRYLASVSSRGVRLFNRRLRERTEIYPELQALRGRLSADRALLDGEVVVLERGRPSFPLALKRDLKARYASGPPAVYAVFDLLSWGDEDIRRWPLEERKEILTKIFRPGRGLELVVGRREGGRALFDEMCRAGWEGVVAKRTGSPYVSGKSPAWLKIKCSREIWSAVVGIARVALERAGMGSLALAARVRNQLVYVGGLRSGIAERDWERIVADLKGLEVSSPPCAGVPASEAPKFLWIQPRLGIRVRFYEWTRGGRLRAPRAVGYAPWKEVDGHEIDGGSRG